MAFSNSKPQAQTDQKNTQAAAVRAMKNNRKEHHHVFSDKQRPVAASSSSALAQQDAKEREALEKIQLAAYGEPLVDAKKDVKLPPKTTHINNAALNQKHNPDTLGEAMSVRLPDAQNILLDYLDGDLITYYQNDNDTKKFSTEQRQQFTLFGAKPKVLMYKVGSEKTALVANLILRGEKKEVNEVLALVKQNPDLLRIQCIATDPLGRRVAGTPLQIAAMAGDVNLIKDEIKEEHNRGLVERLKAVASLSNEEVSEQLKEVLTSKEAVAENEKRNEHILAAIKAFGEGIILKAEAYQENKRDYNNFRELQALCQPLIDQLEKALTPNINEVIKSGTIFDPIILQKAAEWFEANARRFGGWYDIASNVWWVNGFGKLQSKLSSRDAQVVRAGIENLVDGKKVPERTLLNFDGSSYFYKASALAVDFYLGSLGDALPEARPLFAAGGCAGFGELMSSKNSCVAKLMRPDNPKLSSCLIM